MRSHLRANLLLLASTIVVCCVMYPVVMYAIGRGLFPTAASGSIVTENGVVRGSRLIAQPFTADEYFWPRPSAAGYNATASGASNWGANNPKLRDRVAQFIGPIVQFKKTSRFYTGTEPAKAVQTNIVAWFAAKPDRAAEWASEFEVAAANWAKSDLANEKYGLPGDYIQTWATDHTDVVAAWKSANPSKTDEPKPEELVPFFFASFVKIYPAKWPGVVEMEQPDKSIVKRIAPVSTDAAIPALFFEMWLRDPANKDQVADLEPVSADMVMASASGLDPHISLRNAVSVYQLDRVANKRTSAGVDGMKLREDIAALARSLSFTPLGGLVGEPLVNVLELNLALDKQFPMNDEIKK